MKFPGQSLGLKTCIGIRDDEFNVFRLNTVKEKSDEKVHKSIFLGKQNDYVCVIETETHDFNCRFLLIVHNTDSFVLSFNTKDTIKVFQSLEDIFDFSNLDENHELFSIKNKKVFGKFEIETPKISWIGEFICLRSKAYSFKLRNDNECKNKLKGLNNNVLTLTNIKNVWLGRIIRRDVIIILFEHLIMKGIFKK